MSLSAAQGPNVVVALGATSSPAMIMDHTISDAQTMSILSPAGMAEAATIEISLDFATDYVQQRMTLAAATAAATWQEFDSLGAAGDVVNVAVGEMVARAWRITLDGAAAAARTFICVRHTPVMA